LLSPPGGGGPGGRVVMVVTVAAGSVAVVLPRPMPRPLARWNAEGSRVIWLISLGTCFVCETTATERIDLGYAHHESARGTTES
jgi:hypothetical protein